MQQPKRARRRYNWLSEGDDDDGEDIIQTDSSEQEFSEPSSESGDTLYKMTSDESEAEAGPDEEDLELWSSPPDSDGADEHEPTEIMIMEIEIDDLEMDLVDVPGTSPVPDEPDYEVSVESSICSSTDSQIKTEQAVCSLFKLYLRHNWSKKCLEDTLKFMNQYGAKELELPYTLSSLLVYLRRVTPEVRVIQHFHCTQCKVYIGPNNKVCNECKTGASASCFYELDLFDQIKNLFEFFKIEEHLKKFIPPNKENTNPKIIHDITDGEEYIRVNSREDRGEHDLTIVLNTDGISISKSSKKKCWPILAQIAELPYYLRNKYILFLGIWVEDVEPDPLIFFKPIIDKLKEGFKKGIEWKSTVDNKTHVSKITAPFFAGDGPARAKVQGIQYPTGMSSCNYCECSRIEFKSQDQKGFSYFPFDNHIVPRTTENMTANLLEAQKTKRDHVKGVKTKSALADLDEIDLGSCCLPDYMHTPCLGLSKKKEDFWFDDKNSESYIGNHLNEMNEFMVNIKPPYFFRRLPRSLDQRHLYKASEHLYWILFYSLPTVSRFLKPKFLEHWMLFVNALYILLQEEISFEDVKESQRYLNWFISDIENLYGKRAMTYNSHTMRHFPTGVKKGGPLWGSSTFPFESVNGKITRMIHGSINTASEIANNVEIMQRILCLEKEFESNKESTDKRNVRCTILKNTEIKVPIDPRIIQYLESKGFLVDTFYFSAKINCGPDNQFNLFKSSLKASKTNSSCVKIIMTDLTVLYGEILLFFIAENRAYFLLNYFNLNEKNDFKSESKNFKVKHIKAFTVGHFKLIQISKIKKIVHVVKVGNYVCELPCRYIQNL